jgi:hypothetical protein
MHKPHAEKTEHNIALLRAKNVQRFGRLIVIQRMNSDKHRNSRWLCQCKCENEIIVRTHSLASGKTKSCGCLAREKTIQRLTKHGHSQNDKTYKSWQYMKARCTNPDYQYYQNYGGRGITVCDRWKNSFLNFLADMGNRPTDKHTIERINRNGNYCPENCCWATRKEQARNTRRNRLITHNGKTQCIAEWSEEIGILWRTLHSRIYNYGWSIERALTTPVGKYKKRK